MSSQARSGQRSILKRSNAAFPAQDDFTAIAEIRSIAGPEFARDMLEVTTMYSNFHKEYVPGNIDLGDITMDANFVPGEPTLDEKTGTLRDLEEGVRRYYRIVFPDEARTYVQFEAFVKQQRFTMAQNDPLSVNLVLKATGTPTWGING